MYTDARNVQPDPSWAKGDPGERLDPQPLFSLCIGIKKRLLEGLGSSGSFLADLLSKHVPITPGLMARINSQLATGQGDLFIPPQTSMAKYTQAKMSADFPADRPLWAKSPGEADESGKSGEDDEAGKSGEADEAGEAGEPG